MIEILNDNPTNSSSPIVSPAFAKPIRGERATEREQRRKKVASTSFLRQQIAWTLVAAFCICFPHFGWAQNQAETTLAQQRMELMKKRASKIKFSSDAESFPDRLRLTPLFRYDDVPRGYVDGAVWRTAGEGRPNALITTELHPDFFGGGSKIIYEFLSLNDDPFVADASDFPSWAPSYSGIVPKSIGNAPPPAGNRARRLLQIKRLAARFTAMQEVEGQILQLRLLPSPIDRYTPEESEDSDGAIFVFVSGRMPGLVLLIETDGKIWRYAVGRLSRPSDLIVKLDDDQVWQRSPSPRSWTAAYTSTNAPADVPMPR